MAPRIREEKIEKSYGTIIWGLYIYNPWRVMVPKWEIGKKSKNIKKNSEKFLRNFWYHNLGTLYYKSLASYGTKMGNRKKSKNIKKILRNFWYHNSSTLYYNPWRVMVPKWEIGKSQKILNSKFKIQKFIWYHNLGTLYYNHLASYGTRRFCRLDL
jgi:hypothetical protein